MKKINTRPLIYMVATLVVFVFSSSYAIAGDAALKRVPAEVHKHVFPDGHDTPGKGCYYDEKESVYFCSFNEEQAWKDSKKMKMDGETVYKRMPHQEHVKKFPDGHDAPVSGCYYNEKDSVYFCSYDAEVAGVLRDTRTFKRVPAEKHKRLFHDGHDSPGQGCYFDEKEAVYFCSHAK